MKTTTPLKIEVPGQTKKSLPDYVSVNGVLYERIMPGMIMINTELDLNKEVQAKIKRLVKTGTYVNEQEVVRDVLRRKFEDNTLNGS